MQRLYRRERREILERQEAILKLREDLKLEYRTVHEKFLEIQKVHLMLYYLKEEVESLNLTQSELNGFEENEAIKALDECSDELIEKIKRFLILSQDNSRIMQIANYLKDAYQVSARRNFEKFLIAIEYNYPRDMKFYDIRKNVLKEWVEYLENLEYGRLKGLSISAPPRTRENDSRWKIFYLVYVTSPREKLFLCKSYIGDGNKIIQ